jgi:hypothetical protein
MKRRLLFVVAVLLSINSNFCRQSRRSWLRGSLWRAFLLASRIALLALRCAFLFTRRFALPLCEIHTSNGRTRTRSLKATDSADRRGVGLNCAISVTLQMAARRSSNRRTG